MKKEEILNLISNNKTKLALKQLIEALADEDLKIEVILLKRRLESLDQKVRLGLIDEKDRNLEENNISHSAIQLISSIDFYDLEIDTEKDIDSKLPHEGGNLSTEKKEKANATRSKSSTIFSIITFISALLIITTLIYWFFISEEPVDCFDRLQIRNSENRVATESKQFDKVYYEDISGFIVTFEKEKIRQDSSPIKLEVTVIYDKDDKKNNRDTLLAHMKMLKYSHGNFHIEFKKGGEAYILTKFERYYENRNTIHAVYASKPLQKLLIEQLERKELKWISFFNSIHNLSPRMHSTFLDAIDNEENLNRLGQSLKCLIAYDIK